MTLVIRQERISRGWTLEYVAKIIGLTKAAYRNIETGKRKPSQDVLFRLLDLFNYSDPRELFREVEAAEVAG